ncbi:MAG: recombinase family protein [Chloroflexi bacterium]|nr:recombinase family protein [Chloroflexota bacterium]
MSASVVDGPSLGPQDRPTLVAQTAPDPKIHSRHLTRQAMIYVRQSHPNALRQHPESARRQYGLTERAHQLGWGAEQLRVIDEDQGKTGAGSAAAHGRDGFAELVSAVGLGQVGLVLVLEVSRLARNSAEWYRLIELCALSGTLIADDATVYDPRLFNDRLLLGLRGTISEVELHCIKERLDGARLSKARRGELSIRLPAGYVGGPDGQIALDPDQEVQGAIRTIFAQFERLGTATAVLRFFNDHGLTIPRRRWHADSGAEIVWMRPSYQAIYTVLQNPTYAGAYVYGQRGRDPSGSLALGDPGPRKRFALDQVEVLLRDHHAAYIGWERYLANRAALRDNSRQFRPSRGAPQRGGGLLQGLVVCGRCGCRMRLHYGTTSAAYICMTRHKRYGEPVCQSLTIEHVDQAVTEVFLQVMEPAQVDAALALAEDLERDRAVVARQWELRLERARYEAERASRQYDLCEPENRLVARELEGHWNEKLRAVADLETEYRREQDRGLSPLTDEEEALLRRLVGDVRTLGGAAETARGDRKRLVRCLIREVVLLRDDRPRATGGVTTIRIGWCSGAWSELRVRRPSSTEFACTPEPVLERIRGLARQHPDDQVATILNAEGLHTRKGLAWTDLRVGDVRLRHGIPTACPLMPKGGEPRGDGLVSVAQVATQLGLARSVVGWWCRCGFLDAVQLSPLGPRWIRLTEEDLARVDGTLAAQGYGRWRLREAQRVLGLSEEDLYQQVREKKLLAYRARINDHWEWRVSPAAWTGADTPLQPVAFQTRIEEV